MSTTRVYLVRHGATTVTAEDRFAGSTDVELSDEGRQQAQALGRRLASVPLSQIYSSPMKRAVSTATYIAEPHRLVPTEIWALHEVDHGRWEGRTRDEAAREFPEEFAAWTEDPFRCAPEGGESGVQVMARALAAMRTIVERDRGQTIAVVSHKATIRLLVCAWLGIDARGYRDRMDQSPAALNALDFKDPTQARLLLFNDISHYSDSPLLEHPRLSPVWTAAAPN
ncbi:MAG TPA: histidine phosphatase family protein [Nannocystaceae bacterium]|nr:histidine phosphatase family protein [Nannocystaceae bacterium]